MDIYKIIFSGSLVLYGFRESSYTLYLHFNDCKVLEIRIVFVSPSLC